MTEKVLEGSAGAVQGAGSAAPAQPAYDGLPTPRRHWATLTVLAGISMAVLDATIANVALPTIATALHTDRSSVVWVVNAYTLAVVMLLLPISAIAERVGFRRVFGFGAVLFTIASLGCALSPTLPVLTMARAFQGVGAATLMGLFGGMVRNIYPTRLIARGISLNATTVALMSVLGPTIGSAILAAASWPWIFAVNVPIGLLVVFGVRFLPDAPRNHTRFDIISCLLSMVTLGIFITGVDHIGRDTGRALLLIAISIVTGTLLVRRSRKQPAPLVPVDLLALKPIAFAVAASACTFAAQMAAYVALPFYFQQVLHRPYLQLGVLMGAWPMGTALMAFVAGRVADKINVSLLAGGGAATMVVGMGVIMLLPESVPNWPIFVAMFICGLGFSFFQTPNNRTLLASGPRNRSGAAGGLQATTRLFGQSLGVALVGISFGVVAATHGAVLALGMAILCALAAALINVVRFVALRRRGLPQDT